MTTPTAPGYTGCADIALEAAAPHELHSGGTALTGDGTSTATVRQAPTTVPS
jgi:hypothetical protein